MLRRALPCLCAGLLLGCPGGGEPASGNSRDIPGADEVADAPDAADTEEALDVEADTGPGLQLTCGNPAPLTAPFPAEGIGVRITNPTGRGGITYTGGTAQLGGVAFGEISALTWRLGEQSGTIAPQAFWQTAGIPLQPGDNQVIVEATGADGSKATDRVLVTAHPAPIEGVRLTVEPDHVYTAEPRTLRFGLAVPVGDVSPDQVELYLVNGDGTNVMPAEAVSLTDAGDPASCDDVAGDRVFGACRTVTVAVAGERCYRARFETASGATASPVTCVDVIERITPETCEVASEAVLDAGAAYAGAGDHAAGLVAAREALSAAGAIEVGDAAGGYGVWGRLTGGPLVALPLGVPEGFRGTPVQSRRVLMMRGGAGGAELETAAARFRPDTCPPFSPSGPHAGDQATVERWRQLGQAGVIAFAGHGGAFFEGQAAHFGWHHPGAQEVFWTGSPVDCAALQTEAISCTSSADCPGGSHCVGSGGTGECVDQVQADLATGRLVMGPDTYGITPAFVEQYAGRALPRTLVYAGSCQSALSGAMAMEFLAAGAGAYVGFSDIVRDEYAQKIGEQLFDGLTTEQATVEEALCHGADPAHNQTRTRLFGGRAISTEVSGIFNADFERSGLQGWAVSGDARQLTSFCGQSPTQGRFMALASTGLGAAAFTSTDTTFEQTFCIPSAANTLTFWWRYFSAELEQSCGADGPQDRWEVTLTRAGSSNPVEVKRCQVNDMCLHDVANCHPKPCAPPSTGCGCGDCLDPDDPKTLYSAVDACTFDGLPVMATGFVRESFNVSSLAGLGPVTLRIRVSDKGDGLFDTAILLDDIRLQ